MLIKIVNVNSYLFYIISYIYIYNYVCVGVCEYYAQIDIIQFYAVTDNDKSLYKSLSIYL